MRIVIDTNVLVSAIIDDGKPRQLVLKLLEEHTIILSRQMLAELSDVIARDKFKINRAQVNRFLSNLTSISKIVPDSPRFKVIMQDFCDDVVLNAAYTGKADYIVTGDKHLLSIEKFKKTKIVNMTQLFEILN